MKPQFVAFKAFKALFYYFLFVMSKMKTYQIERLLL